MDQFSEETTKRMKKDFDRLDQMRFITCLLWLGAVFMIVLSVGIQSGNLKSVDAGLLYLMNFGSYLPMLAIISNIIFLFRKNTVYRKAERMESNTKIDELQGQIHSLEIRLEQHHP